MGRNDALKIKMEAFKKIELHLMKRRCDSQVYYTPNYDLTKTLPFIDEYNAGKEKSEHINFYSVFLTAVVRTLALNPNINRFIAGRRIWQRNEISLSFVIKKKLISGGEETFTNIKFSPYDNIETAGKRIRKDIKKAKSDSGNESEEEFKFFAKIPRLILMGIVRLLETLDFFGCYPKAVAYGDPMRGSVIIANLGSVGLEGNIVHHLYEFGTIPIFLTVNKIARLPYVDSETDQVISKTMVPVGIAIDERISEGFDLSLALKDIRHYIENPEHLLAKPDLSDAQLYPFSEKYIQAREKELQNHHIEK